MANTTLTPNMLLPVPVTGQDPGPNYADNINSCMQIVDGHTHTPGAGAPITPGALNINASVPFNNNFATSLAGASLTAQTSLPANNTLFESGVDLHFIDGNGNNIPLTANGTIAGTAGNIANLTSPASASFNTATFTWQSNTSIAANMDFGAAIFRNLSPNSTNGITLQAPASLASNYALTLPADPSLQSGTGLMTLSNAGAIVAAVPDSTITIAGSTVGVATGGVTNTQIANSTITGAKVSSNINLPGDTVQENGKNVVVSNTNAAASLAIVRGYCTPSPSIVTGEGFSISRTNVGRFAITFTTAFSDVPAITATISSTVGIGVVAAMVTNPTVNGFSLLLYNSSSALIDINFSFIAIGQRV